MELSLKYYKTTLFIGIVLVLSGVIDWTIISIFSNFSEQPLRLPTNATIIGLLLLAYNQWGWNVPVLKLLVKVPDLSGRYKGHLAYDWQGQKHRKECVIEIVQTASFIHLYLYTDNNTKEGTYSKSISEELVCEDGHYKLIYLYNNFGSDNKKLAGHEGFNVLRVQADAKGNTVLKGYYFTNRDPQTRGEIKVKFKSAKIKHKF